MTTRKQVHEVLHDYKWFFFYMSLMLTIIAFLLLVQVVRGNP